MHTIKRQTKTFLLAASLYLAGVIIPHQEAHASGFGLREGAADWLGNSFVGGEAKAYDAGTVYTNPAGMALLTQSQLSSNLSYIGPFARFKGANTNVITGQTDYGQTGNVIAPAASTAMFAVFVLNPKFRLGISLTNPYGERTSYPKGWVGRYQGLVTNITGIDASLAISYRVNHQLSLGGGPVIEYFHSRLTQAINSGAIYLAQTPPSDRAEVLPLAENIPDGLGDVHGGGIALGYNLGLLYRLDSKTRFGLDYRSRIRHNLSVTQIIKSPLPGQSSVLKARTTITTPDTLSFGIYHQLTSALAVMSSVQWTHWALFNQLHITPRGATPGTIGAQGGFINEAWRNSWFAGIAANDQINSRLMVQTGFAFDESPVTNSNRNSRAPDANHFDLGFGLKYQLLPGTTLDLAYLHVFSPGGTIDSTGGQTTGTQTGRYQLSDNSVTAGMNIVF